MSEYRRDMGAASTRHGGSHTVEFRRGAAAELAVYAFGRAPPHRRILVLKLDHFGDFLIAQPALQKLRRAFPQSHIRLLCGPWNEAAARASGVADEVCGYAFFPENGSQWRGQPVEALARFQEAARGEFDVAIDLRVDEDTRFLLKHVDARLKCGIGARGRHPFLDIVLPGQFEDRQNQPPLVVPPDRFQSRMPVRTPLYHESDFSVTDTHVIYGPDLALPAGRYRAVWGLQLGTALPLPSPARLAITLDVTRRSGAEQVAARLLSRRRMRQLPAASALEFANLEPGAAHEFRVHVRGRPRGARLRFFGVWVESLDRAPPARFKTAELHVGEQLSLLVQLVEDRLRPGADRDPWREQAGGEPAELAALPAAAKRIVVAPLSNSATRDWGLDHYARLVERLLGEVDCAVLLVGAPAQRDALAAIAGNGGNPRVVNLAGRSDWRQTAGIVRAADLVIANNSGIAHLAAACGTATLAIYSGSHQAQEWGPRGPQARALSTLLPCSPCGYEKLELCPNDHACMKLITPDIVAAEALAMLAGGTA